MVDAQPQMQAQHQSFSKPQSSGGSGSEKIYLIQDIMSKLNRTEPLTFGNFFVDFSEIFPQESDYKDYLKERVSLFNNDKIEKAEYKPKSIVYKKEYISKMHYETLFYIFYYMTKDVLQLYAAQELYKKGWNYYVDNEIWFKLIEKEEGGEQGSIDMPNENKWIYFNPLEWKIDNYVFGTVDQSKFLSPEEVSTYILVHYKQINNNKIKKSS